MFFGWRVVSGAFVSMMLVVGFYTYAFTLLVTPLRETFGASLEDVMYSMTLTTMTGLFMGPLAGIVIDRFSLRYLLVLGNLVLAGGLWLLGQAQSILAFNITFAATFSIGNLLAGSMASNAAVTRWFVRSRGRALGIATIGTSVGGVVVPALVSYWIANGGWRSAVENTAYVVLFLVTPFVWLNVRNRPADLGLQPDGAPAPVDGETPAPVAALGMKDIIRMPQFWYIGISVSLLIAAFSSMMANLSPYAMQLGASTAEASALIMALAIAGLCGKIGFGIMADKISLQIGMWMAQGLVAAAFLIMAMEPAYGVVFLASILLGIATGGLLPVWNAMLAEVFGVASFGRAMGAMSPMLTLLVMPAFPLVGRAVDTYGNYVPALLAATGLLVVAAALLVPLKIER